MLPWIVRTRCPHAETINCNIFLFLFCFLVSRGYQLGTNTGTVRDRETGCAMFGLHNKTGGNESGTQAVMLKMYFPSLSFCQHTPSATQVIKVLINWLGIQIGDTNVNNNMINKCNSFRILFRIQIHRFCSWAQNIVLSKLDVLL